MLQPEMATARPATTPDELSKSIATDAPSVPKRTDVLGDLDALAEHLRGYFVVQVVVNDAGHRRTYIYRTTAAAERAVERARSRGRHATTTLCQLYPVGSVTPEVWS